MPSMGSCSIPSTVLGSGMPAASRMVGPMSMQWVNWERSSPSALIRPGQATTIGSRVPPRWLAICLPHWNGVLPACAHAAAIVRRGVVAAERLDAAVLLDQLQLLLGVEHDAVEERHLVERAGDRALHAGAVVAPDVEDERVVEVAHLLDARPAGGRRSSRRSPGSRRRPPSGGRRASSASSVERVPGGEQVGPLGQLGVLRDDPELLLALERLARAARPSRRRTCPCTCPPTPWRRGAARARSRSSSTSSTACRRPARGRRAATRPPCR